MGLVRYTARTGKKEIIYKVLVWKAEGKAPLGKPYSRWKVDIKKHLKGLAWEGAVWMHLTQETDKYVNDLQVL
jgi:hypothetical protein